MNLPVAGFLSVNENLDNNDLCGTNSNQTPIARAETNMLVVGEKQPVGSSRCRSLWTRSVRFLTGEHSLKQLCIRIRRLLTGATGCACGFCVRTKNLPMESAVRIAADVDCQWGLFLANTYTLDQLQELEFSTIKLPSAWFVDWRQQLNDIE